jgi:ERCC4-type nuclease
LLREFGTVAAIAAADARTLERVAGIGERRASALIAALHT